MYIQTNTHTYRSTRLPIFIDQLLIQAQTRRHVALRAYSEYGEYELDDDFMSELKDTTSKVIGMYTCVCVCIAIYVCMYV
jgi:hypothetical protein